MENKELITYYLVYEVNYLTDCDVDCVEESDFKLFQDEKNAFMEMNRRKDMYEKDMNNGFTFMEDESTRKCIVFADRLSTNGDYRSGEFHICMKELDLN